MNETNTTRTTGLPEDVDAWPATLCEAFQRTVTAHADRIALRTAGGEQEYTWRDYGQRVRSLASGLAALGIGRGDTVALMLTNRPEAFFVDTAVLHTGATPFSVYTTSSTAQLEYLLGHAESPVVVVEAQFADRILEVQKSLPSLRHVVVLAGDVTGTTSLAALEGAAADDFDFEASWRGVAPDDVAVLIYTSGTTGSPKAVELTHANILASRRSYTTAIPALARPGRYMSYLPMAHMADRQVAYYPAMLTGSTITTFTDPRVAMASLREVRPTLSATVPRMWEKLKDALEAQFAQSPAVNTAVQAAMRKTRLELAGEPVPAALAEACRQADATIFAKVREQIGFDDADALMSGAAPIGEEVMVFFSALGMPILEVYGMSETATAGTINRPHGIRIGTVGQALPEMELTLAEDGEILLRGPAVMRGYRNDPEKTAEAIDEEGWLHTGDIGTLDDDGYVRIVDRKKELIINSYGKNMSPAHIEAQVKAAHSLIGFAVAVGDQKPYTTALLALDPEGALEYAKANGLTDSSIATLAKDDGVIATLDAAIAAANQRLSNVERVKKFTVLADEWQPDSDVLTPTMKLKRKPIMTRYSHEIEAMYRG